jgi:hypothetical protein
VGLNLDDKKAVVAEVAAQLADAQTIVVAEYSGVQVTDLTVLRAKARQSGVYLRVLKNTLVRRAVAGTQFEPLAESMSGPLIYSISADPVAAAKVLNDFAKGNDKLVLKTGAYAARCSTRLRFRLWPRSPAAKNCSPACWASCRRRSPASRAPWPPWPSSARNRLPKPPPRNSFIKYSDLGVARNGN